MITIDIETQDLETRKKRDGGTYQVQSAYVHLFDRNGQPERYPRQISVFPPKDPSGNSVPYKPGVYTLSSRCFQVKNGFLDFGFVQLEPAKR